MFLVQLGGGLWGEKEERKNATIVLCKKGEDGSRTVTPLGWGRVAIKKGGGEKECKGSPGFV